MKRYKLVTHDYYPGQTVRIKGENIDWFGTVMDVGRDSTGPYVQIDVPCENMTTKMYAGDHEVQVLRG